MSATHQDEVRKKGAFLRDTNLFARNAQLVLQDGEHTGQSPGRVLRKANPTR